MNHRPTDKSQVPRPIIFRVMSELLPNPTPATAPSPLGGVTLSETDKEGETRAAELLIQLMAGTIATQLANIGSTTAKMLGVLTFDGAVTALIVANENHLSHWALLSLLPLLVSIGACAYGLRSTHYGAGPRAEESESAVKRDLQSGQKFYLEILHHLRDAIITNEAVAARKALIVTIAVFGFTAAPVILVVILCLGLMGVIQ